MIPEWVDEQLSRIDQTLMNLWLQAIGAYALAVEVVVREHKIWPLGVQLFLSFFRGEEWPSQAAVA